MRNRFHFDPDEVAVGDDRPLPEALALDGRPLHVEIGFGKDVRVLREAEARDGELFLGVEISRKKCRKFCEKVARLGLRNVRAYQGDVRVLLEKLLPPGSVASFTILFPDPWPKRRQQKHRWIDRTTARRLRDALQPGGRLTVATDHPGYAGQIRDALAAAGLALVEERTEVPEEDRTLFTERFERQGRPVTYQVWANS